MKKLLYLLLCLATPVFAQKWEGLALTPPMGWNSWNTFACDNINEKVVRETADTMATNGMRDAGYVYIVIDDGWSKMELVLMLMTTKPWEATRRAIHAIVERVAVKPGAMATAPNVPWEVVVG